MAALSSPDHVALGATDLGRTTRFFEALGFEASTMPSLDAEVAERLYGLDRITGQTALRVRGASRGWIRLVATPHVAATPGPFDRGPHAIDLYTTDIAASAAAAAAAGALVGPIVPYRVGPIALKECKAVGPDHTTVVFIEVNRRRPSVLDRDFSRLHSEVHSIVTVVDDVDRSLRFWQHIAGLVPVLDSVIREPAVAQFMGLPRSDAPLRLAVLGDVPCAPIRFELLGFPEDAGGRLPDLPLVAGLPIAAFAVDRVPTSTASLPGVTWRDMVQWDQQRGVSGLASDQVRFEIWEPAAR